MATNASGGIFLLGDDGGLVQLREQRFDSEDVFQALLERHPELLAGELIDPENPRRWLMISREIPFYGDAGHIGWIDHVLIDQDGIPTFVEVKRSTDTRIRREVVGQLLEYVANAVVFWELGEIRARFADTAGGVEAADEQVLTFLDGDDPEAWWQQVETNLRARRVRMLFVADVIPASLKRIIEFLNETMDPPQVLAVEIRQYAGGVPAQTSLVPRVYGQTAAASAKRTSSPRGEKWTEERWWAALTARSAEAAQAIRPVVDWARQHMDELWLGEGKVDGSLSPSVRMSDGRAFFPFILWTYGKIEMHFAALSQRPPFDALQLRRDLRDRLNQLPGVEISDDKLNSRPPIPMITLADAAARDHFIKTMDWVLEQLDTPDVDSDPAASDSSAFDGCDSGR